jgi:ectoine hydroxylase-related dioxygenase (phytanoyl-CoA dioxygenase family)
LFDKSLGKSWSVTLHQDLSIPVKEKVDHPQCSGWSVKEGTLYVQPPMALLRHMVAVRLHLDDCGIENGPLRVVSGSHSLGRVSDAEMEAAQRTQGDTVCTVPRGGALVMRPLLLHASSKATARSQRRVLHFVFAPPNLPHGLSWSEPV